jgi:tetratricopeptide (TPR) repeat protein
MRHTEKGETMREMDQSNIARVPLLSLMLCLLTVLAFQAFSSTSLLYADKVVTTSGREIEGRIIEENDRVVRIQTPTTGIVEIPRRLVREIRVQDVTETEAMGDHALVRGDYYEALERFEEALAEGKGSPELKEKIEQTRATIRKVEDERYRRIFEEAKRQSADKKRAEARRTFSQVFDTAKPDSFAARRARRAIAGEYFIEYTENQVMVRYSEALGALEKAVESDPSFIMGHLELARLYRDFNNNSVKAIESFKRGVALGKEFLAQDQSEIDLFKDVEPVRAFFDRRKLSEYQFELAVLLYNSALKQEASERFQLLLEEDSADLSSVRRDEVVKFIGRVLTDIDPNVKMDYEKTLAGLDMALKYDPRLAVAWFWKGYIFFMQLKYPNAIASFSKAIELDGAMADAYKFRANAYLRVGDIAAARYDLEKLTRDSVIFGKLESKDRYDAFVRLGDVLLEGLLHDQALEAYNNAIRMERELIPGYMGRARLYRSQAISPATAGSQFDAYQKLAWDDIEWVIGKNPDLLEAVLIKGKLIKDTAKKNNDQNLFAQASVELERVVTDLSSLPADTLPFDKREILADANCELGEIQLLGNNRNLARARYESALKVLPDYPRAYNLLGQEAQKSNNFEKAETEFKKAIELAPQNPDFELNLAIMYHDQKKYKEAIERYNLHRQKAGKSADPRAIKWIQECEEGLGKKN